MIGGACCLFTRLPSSFLPEEDQGVLMTIDHAAVGRDHERTKARGRSRSRIIFSTQEKDDVEGVFAALGFGFGGTGQNTAMAFVKLKDFDERKGDRASTRRRDRRPGDGAPSRSIRDAQVFALSPPAIHGLGTSNGFDMYLRIRRRTATRR